MQSKQITASILCLILSYHETIQPVQSVSIEEDLTLSYSQGLVLDKFKDRMLPMLKEDYMKEDIYLIRWLRAKDFNIDEAQKMLTNNLRWRIENRIEDINKEDWTYFKEEFSFSLETTDFESRPIITIDSEKWDVRSAVVSGKREKLNRWMIKMLEDATIKVRHFQDEGKNVSRWGMIYNLAYFNLAQSGCFQCLSVYASFVNNYENYYPNTADSITLVNTPTIFDIVLRFIRPIMTPGTRSALRVLGTNKLEWQDILLNEIPRSQLSEEYGGAKARSDEFD